MNGAFTAYAGGRVTRRVTPCPTTPPAGIAASGGGAADVAGATSDPDRRVVPTEVTGMAAPWVVSSANALTCATRISHQYRPRDACRPSKATLLPSTAAGK